MASEIVALTQQGDRQASIRAVTGTQYNYEGDWHALFDLAGVPVGTFDGRMLAWINLKLGAAYTNINEALQALASSNGVYNFSSLGSFDCTTTPAAPVNTVAPILSGIRTQGQVLTSSTGSWTGSPLPTYTYQWKRGASNIGGATASTYTLVLADVGQSITCVVTATNASGNASQASNAVTPAAALSISGTPASTGTVGTSYSFTPTASGGHTTYVFSLTGTLPAGLSFSTTTGAITGTPTTAQTVTGLNVTLTDADGLTASLGAFSIAVSGSSGAPAILLETSGYALMESGSLILLE